MSGWWIAGGVLLVEGLFPLLFTRSWRQTMAQLLQLRDGQIRFIGCASAMAGLLIMWLSR